MIRRDSGNHFLLFTQDDHAQLAARVMEHFGNHDFKRPVRLASFMTAVRMHDSGWPLHDDLPTLNAKHQPIDVFESTRTISLRVWAASADRTELVDPYAGLLVSLHILALSVYATSHPAASPANGWSMTLPADRFEINKFQHREIERQEKLRKQIGLVAKSPLRFGLAPSGISRDEDELTANLRLLQAGDLMSLCLCCTEPPADRTTELATRSTSAALKLSTPETNELVVEPWPFDSTDIELKIPAKRIPKAPFESEASFQSVYQQSLIEMQTMIVRPV